MFVCSSISQYRDLVGRLACCIKPISCSSINFLFQCEELTMVLFLQNRVNITSRRGLLSLQMLLPKIMKYSDFPLGKILCVLFTTTQPKKKKWVSIKNISTPNQQKKLFFTIEAEVFRISSLLFFGGYKSFRILYF